MDSDKLFIKENVVRRPPVSLGWLAAAAALTAALLAVAALVDVALPEPLTRAAPPHRFIAEIAQEHLVNLTSIGPRVAGSYENEVLGVGVVVEAVKRIARAASPHVRVELDVQIASGAFSLSFLDGMNHVYQHVSSVVARVSAAGGAPRGRRRALLLNCHIDTVPDSPGASDDGAGCAVLLETMRALAAGAAPRHDAVFLFNAAEENVLQASHGFITQHKWAKSVRAFINIEACGAGGREVLFQAGPHDPWIVEMYAGAVPHPFASSLAQELFESGLIPADTDFRIFRDFGKLSGVDLAWSANGYVYHTALDTAARVPPAALQRTGDNVLALARGMLASESLESEVERSARQPVFFDVVGLLVLSARAPAALLAAALALALAALLVQRTAVAASRDLYLGEGRAAWWGWCGWWGWWGCAGAGAGVWLAAQLAGLGAAAGVALLLHALGSRLAFYARPWLLAPLYALPALAAAWTTAASLARRRLARLRGAGGWWAARALHQGGTLCCATTLACCALRGVRSGFLPWLWTALPAAAGCLGSVRGGRAAPAWWWAGGALLPVLQTWYLALGSLRMFVPVMGRAGAAHPVPPDVAMALLTAALVLGACSWLLPLVVAARPLTIKRIVVVFSCGCAGACALALGGGARAGYSEAAPQRLMVLHTRRTTHAAAAVIAQEHFYWMPQLDANAPHSVDPYAEEMAAARLVPASECARWPYCGMPYYLPVLGLAAASHRAPAAAPPASTLLAAVRARRLNATHAELLVRIAAGPAHVVLIVSPAAGARVAWTSALASPLAGVEAGPGPGAGRGGRLTYFFALHSARAPHAPLTLLLQREEAAAGGEAVSAGTQVSLAGHALFGPRQRSPELARLLRRLPAWTAPTGWSVDLHLYQL